ncbi:hypothetical protein GOM49_17220 [Clostridium bovifaecis]|uniref:Uncharacterized protein n=1 Tax=Clostridium bovifaecis TaxID=2184719 RepID=A0A6I6F037_9CLOT|nr:hypothetical protein GOM49_17220 [Clostridium bovifaecis]
MDGTNFVAHLANYIGETVTIFTTSGGESGSGFTGVLLSVNNCFVRLLSQIGPAPGCALGNCCTGAPTGASVGFTGGQTGRFTCGLSTVGAVTDIPISRIASFIHNAV